VAPRVISADRRRSLERHGSRVAERGRRWTAEGTSLVAAGPVTLITRSGLGCSPHGPIYRPVSPHTHQDHGWTDCCRFWGPLGFVGVSEELHTFSVNRLRRSGPAIGLAGAPHQSNDLSDWPGRNPRRESRRPLMVSARRWPPPCSGHKLDRVGANDQNAALPWQDECRP